MAAINGVKKDKKRKEKNSGESKLSNQTLYIILAIMISILTTFMVCVAIWKFYLVGKVEQNTSNALISTTVRAYKAGADMMMGDSVLDGATVVNVPSSLVASNTLLEGEDLSSLKVSRDIKENELITKNNTYNPNTQDIVLETSRQVIIDYIDTPGAEVGDYIDIRLKTYNDGNTTSYKDDIVCAKKEILSKDGEKIMLMLSEAELLNLNSAVVVTAQEVSGSAREIYTTKYVDPVNQNKASVTYNGQGVQFTEQELVEAQQRLRDMQESGQGGFSRPTVPEVTEQETVEE